MKGLETVEDVLEYILFNSAKCRIVVVLSFCVHDRK